MATFNRYSYLAASGNLPVKAQGEKVILDGKSKNIWNVLAGEIVVWDKTRNLTLGIGDIATAKHVSIGIGQGNKGELATDILHIAGEDFDFCKGNVCANVTKPSCGCAQVVDLFFDCTKCDEVYSFAFLLDDSRVRSEYGFNEKAEYVYSVPTECSKCDVCDVEHNCEEIMCKIVDQINGKTQDDPKLITYFQKANLTDQYQPFRASKIYNHSTSRKRFCINPQDNGCKDCAYLPGITGIKIDGVTKTFDYTTVPGDATKTLHGQMERVIEYINNAITEVGGDARMTDGIKPCCPYDIIINTCATNVKLIVNGNEVSPDEEWNPFVAQTVKPVCKGCNNEETSVNLTCGFSIIVDPVTVDCSCDLPPNLTTPNYYGRTIEPAFIGDAWVGGQFFWKESQSQSLPSGLGYFWQDKAHYGQHNGGSGRNFRYSNKPIGKLGLPDKASRARNAHNLIDCDETYCVYNVVSSQGNNEWFNNATKHYNRDISYVLIPEKDNTTKVSFEAVLTALQARGLCCAGDVVCGVKSYDFNVGNKVASSSFTTNLSTKGAPSCNGALTYSLGTGVNATATISGSSITVTPTATGAFSYTFVIKCDGITVGGGTVSGVGTN